MHRVDHVGSAGTRWLSLCCKPRKRQPRLSVVALAASDPYSQLGMDSLHARVPSYAPSAMDTGFINAPRTQNNSSKTKVTPLRARVNVGTCPELFHSNIGPECQNESSKKVHPRLRNVSSQPSLLRSAPSATLSPPILAHAEPNARTVNGATRRTRQELQFKTGSFVRANTMDPTVAAPEPLKSVPSLLPLGKNSEPASRPISVRANTDKVNKPVRVHVNQRPGAKLLSPVLSPKHAVSMATTQNALHVSPYHKQDYDKVQSVSHSPMRETCHMSRTSPTRASIARSGLLHDQQEHNSTPPPVLFPVLGTRTVPAIPMTPSDTSSSWTECKNQSTLGTLSLLGFTENAHNEVPPTSSTPSDLTMEASNILDARHARKLLDLEISNKSLLAINATLESSKVKLTKELRELRHIMMLQRTSSEPIHGKELSDSIRPSLAELLHPISDANKKRSLGVEVLHVYTQQDQEMDVIHKRCCAKIDELLKEARSALLAKPELGTALGGKVLHPSELQHDTLDNTPVNADVTEDDSKTSFGNRLEDNISIM